MTSWNHEAVVSFVGTTSGTLPGPTDLHVVVLSWLNFHPGHTPEDIARVLRAEDGVNEIAKCCADLAAAGFIEPATPALTSRSGHGSLLA